MTPRGPRWTPESRDDSRTAASRDSDRSRRLDRLDALAHRMDRAFRIPFTGIRFGWDGILGLVPVLGDTLAAGPAVFIMHEAHNMGASKFVLVRMAGNTGFDWLVGLVPLVGDILDVSNKSNMRNVALLRAHFDISPTETKA